MHFPGEGEAQNRCRGQKKLELEKWVDRIGKQARLSIVSKPRTAMQSCYGKQEECIFFLVGEWHQAHLKWFTSSFRAISLLGVSRV